MTKPPARAAVKVQARESRRRRGRDAPRATRAATFAGSPRVIDPTEAVVAAALVPACFPRATTERARPPSDATGFDLWHLQHAPVSAIGPSHEHHRGAAGRGRPNRRRPARSPRTAAAASAPASATTSSAAPSAGSTGASASPIKEQEVAVATRAAPERRGGGAHEATCSSATTRSAAITRARTASCCSLGTWISSRRSRRTRTSIRRSPAGTCRFDATWRDASAIDATRWAMGREFSKPHATAGASRRRAGRTRSTGLACKMCKNDRPAGRQSRVRASAMGSRRAASAVTNAQRSRSVGVSHVPSATAARCAAARAKSPVRNAPTPAK